MAKQIPCLAGIRRMMDFYPKRDGGAGRTDWKRVRLLGAYPNPSLPSYAGVTKKKCKQGGRQTSSPVAE